MQLWLDVSCNFIILKYIFMFKVFYYSVEGVWVEASSVKEVPQGIILIKIVDEDNKEIETWLD